MQRYIRPLAAVTALLLVGGAAGLVLRSGRTGTYEITAYFEKAIGLFPNSDVDVLGVPVGKIRSVEPVGTRVKVVMDVSKEYKVPDDAFAQIVPISVIADRFVQLHPPYTGGDFLQDGAVLDTDRTQIPAELDDVFKQLKKLLEAIEPGKEGEPGALGELIVQLNEALADHEQDLKGTVVNTAALTGSLSDAQEDLSDLLINLDRLFGKLAQRAGSIGSLNKNMAIVMSTLAESRQDLEGTLANLADMTGEVGRVVERHGDRLGNDLRLAANVLDTIVQNRSSVGESFSWLPVVAIGLTNAYNGGEINATDVRDNERARINCDALDDLPPGPIKDALREACKEITGQPKSRDAAFVPTPPDAAPDDALDRTIDCKEGVRKVRRQIRRLVGVKLPADVLDGIIKPLKKKLRRLARECEELGNALGDPAEIIDRIRAGVGDIPALDDPDDPLDDLTGTAAGAAVAPEPAPSFSTQLDRWFDGFIGFLGWSR